MKATRSRFFAASRSLRGGRFRRFRHVGHSSDLLAHSKHCVLRGSAGCQLPMVDDAATPSIGSYAFKYLGHNQNNQKGLPYPRS